jgi:hypothetical protein
LGAVEIELIVAARRALRINGKPECVDADAKVLANQLREPRRADVEHSRRGSDQAVAFEEGKEVRVPRRVKGLIPRVGAGGVSKIHAGEDTPIVIPSEARDDRN